MYWIVSLQKSYVETLTPNVYLEMEHFGVN